MGNESGKQDQKEETPENQAEEIQKDEIPPDTQLNKQYLENSLKNEDQDRKNIIIKEKHYENNEDGIHTKVDERRVEYHISKVNQDNDENVESAENIEYDENAEQMEDNAEGEYEMNQQEEFGEEGYQGGREYINEQINDIENKDYANYPNNFVQGENYSKIVINKSSSSNAGYTNKNIKISGNSPNILIETGGYKGRHTASSYSDIPRYMSFQKAQLQGSGNIRSSLNVVKTEVQSELIEIPKSEYASYAGRETVFIGGGMETGEYKFKGQGIIITQKGSLEGNVEISEEEILKEINRRKNKPKKEKRKKYVILDKFLPINLEFIKNLPKNSKICLDIGHIRFFEHFTKQYLNNFFSYANVIQINDNVLDFLFEKLGIRSLIELYKSLDLELLILTQGKKGATFVYKENNVVQTLSKSPEYIIDIVDSSGAGDAFFSVIIKEYAYSNKIDTSFVNKVFDLANKASRQIISHVGSRISKNDL